MARFITLLVIVLFGIMLADMVAHAKGTKNFFNGIGSLWAINTNAMLGKPVHNLKV